MTSDCASVSTDSAQTEGCLAGFYMLDLRKCSLTLSLSDRPSLCLPKNTFHTHHSTWHAVSHLDKRALSGPPPPVCVCVRKYSRCGFQPCQGKEKRPRSDKKNHKLFIETNLAPSHHRTGNGSAISQRVKGQWVFFFSFKKNNPCLQKDQIFVWEIGSTRQT